MSDAIEKQRQMVEQAKGDDHSAYDLAERLTDLSRNIDLSKRERDLCDAAGDKLIEQALKIRRLENE